MTVKKLSDSDKNEILKLYRETGETTSTLAERYGVSNSTISRFLKSTLPEDEYEELIQQKRAARTFGKDTTQTPLFNQLAEPETARAEPLFEVEPSPETADAQPFVEVEPSPETAAPIPAYKKVRRRGFAASNPETETPAMAEIQLQLLESPSAIAGSTASSLEQDAGSKQENQPQLLKPQRLRIPAPRSSPLDEDVDKEQENQPQRLDRPAAVLGSPSPLDEDEEAEATAVAQMLGEDLLDDSEELMDLDDDEDLEDDDEDDLDEDTPRIVPRRVPSETLVQVLPLSEATLPRTCYLVIDRAAELITRPLRDFGDLGQIPSQEIYQKTLPVFDNHRVARRFSTKRDRVIKIPDSKLLQKTRPQLQAKGITRLLVDGRVYSLSLT